MNIRQPELDRIAADYTAAWNSGGPRNVTGHDEKTGKPLRISGREEWDLNAEGSVAASRGWFDADDYARPCEE